MNSISTIWVDILGTILKSAKIPVLTSMRIETTSRSALHSCQAWPFNDKKWLWDYFYEIWPQSVRCWNLPLNFNLDLTTEMLKIKKNESLDKIWTKKTRNVTSISCYDKKAKYIGDEIAKQRIRADDVHYLEPISICLAADILCIFVQFSTSSAFRWSPSMRMELWSRPF